MAQDRYQLAPVRDARMRDERVRRVSRSGPAELIGTAGASDLAARILEPLKRHHGLVEI